ncbi:hypothetical protein [Rhizobium leguminosarum]|uniref:Uncharacterized protein n=1 Tax=Rhizobium leguminosarum TaxID=384 RepID=A0A2Z4YJA6_RHILE|nr:hypothetical protein [Rhizobium leguminosarum]AXA41109.1 hypothetical protein DLJ82_3540 [Rhizobium leguminosarum]
MAKELSEEDRCNLIGKTAAVAHEAIDDIRYLRRLLTQEEVDSGDIRRASAILRRQLVENTLTRVAAPRIGKLLIRAPNFKPIYVESRTAPPSIFVGAHTSIFGVDFRGLLLRAGASLRQSEFDPEATIDLSTESYGKQEILYYRSRWVSRKSVIEYVANVAGGVHAGEEKSEDDKVIGASRHNIGIKMSNGAPTVQVNLNLAEEPAPRITDGAIDAALLLIHSTAHALVNSPSIARLEAVVEDEGADGGI